MRPTHFFFHNVYTYTLKFIHYIPRTRISRDKNWIDARNKNQRLSSYWREAARDRRYNHKTALPDPSSKRLGAVCKAIPHTHLTGSQSMKDDCARLSHAVHSVVTRPFIASTYPNEKMSQNAQNGSYLKSFSRCRSITKVRMQLFMRYLGSGASPSIFFNEFFNKNLSTLNFLFHLFLSY